MLALFIWRASKISKDLWFYYLKSIKIRILQLFMWIDYNVYSSCWVLTCFLSTSLRLNVFGHRRQQNSLVLCSSWKCRLFCCLLVDTLPQISQVRPFVRFFRLPGTHNTGAGEDEELEDDELEVLDRDLWPSWGEEATSGWKRFSISARSIVCKSVSECSWTVASTVPVTRRRDVRLHSRQR